MKLWSLPQAIAILAVTAITVMGSLPASAEPAPSSPSAQPSQAVALAPAAQLFMSQGAACSQPLFSSTLVPAPIPAAGCQGGEGGPCDTSTQCKGYVCHLGEVRHCFGSTGSGCNGWCGCW
jgi:hypothetical protein